MKPGQCSPSHSRVAFEKVALYEWVVLRSSPRTGNVIHLFVFYLIHFKPDLNNRYIDNATSVGDNAVVSGIQTSTNRTNKHSMKRGLNTPSMVGRCLFLILILPGQDNLRLRLDSEIVTASFGPNPSQLFSLPQVQIFHDVSFICRRPL